MPQIITYVCDISGKSSTVAADFAEVKVSSQYYETEGARYKTGHSIEKLVHKEVLAKLGLTLPKPSTEAEEAAAAPAVSFEAQLKSVLRPWVEEIAQEIVDNR